jgi:hypothetical protein
LPFRRWLNWSITLAATAVMAAVIEAIVALWLERQFRWEAVVLAVLGFIFGWATAEEG